MNLSDGPSSVHLTVVLKATLAYSNEGELTLARPARLTRERGPAPARMVAASSDLAPFLAQTDVWFTGHAHAVGTSAKALSVRLAVGRGETRLVDKTLHVYGDRRQSGARLGSPRSFRRMPIEYERAVGGEDNPFGQNGGAPNIVDPHDPARPVGFGLIPPPWPLRKRLRAGGLRRRRRADEEPVGLSAPLMVIPVGFEWAYFQAAPPDQRCPFLWGDEWVVLDGLHPRHQRLTLQLPEVGARARFSWEGESRDVLLWIDGLHVDGDRHQVTLRWRGCFEVERSQGLRDAVVEGAVLLGGEEVAAWAEAARAPSVDDRQPAGSGPASTIPERPWRIWDEHLKAWVVSETEEVAARRRELGLARSPEVVLRPGDFAGAPWRLPSTVSENG
jgi:hypothetical protein